MRFFSSLTTLAGRYFYDLESAPGSTGQEITGTGALVAPIATVSGSGAVGTATGVSGSGELQITVELAAAGVVGRQGSAALASPKAQVAGSAVRGLRDLPGEIELSFGGGFAVAGEGNVTAYTPPQEIAGTGALQAAAATVQSEAARGVVGDSALTAPRATIAAAAVRGVVGTGALTAAPATLVGGTGPREITGTGELDTAGVSISASGVKRISGVGVLTVAPATLSGEQGAKAVTGSGNLTATKPIVVAQGTRGIVGSGALTAPKVRLRGFEEGAGGGGGADRGPSRKRGIFRFLGYGR